MPQVSDMAYVDRRFAAFVAKYAEVLVKHGHPPQEVKRSSELLRHRLAHRDYHVKDVSRPVCHLHSGKRVTWFFIKSAILYSPGRKRQVEAWRRAYGEKCMREKAENPALCFFSFEAVYAKKLNPSMTPFKQEFRL